MMSVLIIRLKYICQFNKHVYCVVVLNTNRICTRNAAIADFWAKSILKSDSDMYEDVSENETGSVVEYKKKFYLQELH